MDELVAQVAKKTGISPDLAQKAVDTVLNYLKGKLPPAIAGQIDQAIEGGGSEGIAGMAKNLGGMLGKK